MKSHILSFIMVVIFFSATSLSFAATRLEDEGVLLGYINALDIVGPGITATRVGIKGTLTTSAAGIVGGSDTQVQFNDGGVFGGDSGFTFIKASDSVDIAGHMALGADASISATTILSIDETLTTVDDKQYGIFDQVNLEPAGVLTVATHLVAMDMQAQWNSAIDGSVHGSVQGIKGEGINLHATGDINELIGVYGKASNLGESDVTDAIGVLGYVTNDDALGAEDGDVAVAYSLLSRAYTDKDTGIIAIRYGLYIEDTAGGGLLTDQYGIYIEDMASGSASGTTYAIYSLGGNVELTDGTINTRGTLGAGAITGTSFIIGENTLDTNEWTVLDDVTANMVLDWTASVGTIHTDNYVENADQNLWETIATDGTSIAANTSTDTLTIAGGGINVTSQVGDTITITGTEVDGSITNELNIITCPDANVTAGTAITFADTGIMTITEAADTITFDATEVDGSITNELNIFTTDDAEATEGTAIVIAGGGIVTTTEAADTITITGTEAQDLDDVCDLGATTDQTITAANFTTAGLITSGTGTTFGLLLGDASIREFDSGNLIIQSKSGEEVIILLSDASGVREFRILDSNTVTVALIDSDGNMQIDGDLQVDGGDIGITADRDLIQLASGALTANGTLEIVSTTDPQLRLTHTDTDDETDFYTDADGDLHIEATGDDYLFGNAGGDESAVVHILDGGDDNEPGVLILYSDAGTPYYLWVSTAGTLRGDDAYPTDDDAQGVAIADLTL